MLTLMTYVRTPNEALPFQLFHHVSDCSVEMGLEISNQLYRVLLSGCRERHSTHDSPLNFDLMLDTIRSAKSGFND